MRSAAFAALVSVVAAAIPAAAALAHTGVHHTAPHNGQVLERAPRSVSVTFRARVLGGSIAVTRDGETVSAGRGGRSGERRLRVALRRGVRSGAFVVRWRALASDGHPQTGSFRFRVR